MTVIKRIDFLLLIVWTKQTNNQKLFVWYANYRQKDKDKAVESHSTVGSHSK